MSQIRSFDEALDFYPNPKVNARPHMSGLLAKLGACWNALVEGQAAAKQYHKLRDRGASHEEASSKVFAQHFQN